MALVFAIAASSIVLLLAGSNPLRAYGDMLNHASKLETMIDILNRATPLFISGIAAAIGFRMNLFNIGVEGQYLLAALVAAEVGGVISLRHLHVAVILLVGMTVGAAYSGVAGVLKVTRGISEVISTIMLNAIAVSGLIVAGLKLWQAGGVHQRRRHSRRHRPDPEVGAHSQPQPDRRDLHQATSAAIAS